jgi:hypothetical protein
MIRLSRKPGQFCLGTLCVLSLIACASKGNSATSTAAGTTRAESQPGLFPGESVELGFQRLLNTCMDKLGHTDFDEWPDGRSYRTSNKQTEVDLKACGEQASKIALQNSPPADFEKSYSVAQKLVDCLRAAGHDMGILVSREEFVSSGGLAKLSSNWDGASATEDFGDSLIECDAASRPTP